MNQIKMFISTTKYLTSNILINGEFLRLLGLLEDCSENIATHKRG